MNWKREIHYTVFFIGYNVRLRGFYNRFRTRLHSIEYVADAKFKLNCIQFVTKHRRIQKVLKRSIKPS